ncbi:hypothetical protein CEXT_260601 [Caerostris extrusa]|uniref:Uncharacterized protein n=1 Tax=Caerostris extrusa TaxID=172846 RepID=A0AAV4UFH4_CAEEX|nr:hypothetical protein CEXT_260601 [Caerostris extrusa]
MFKSAHFFHSILSCIYGGADHKRAPTPISCRNPVIKTSAPFFWEPWELPKFCIAAAVLYVCVQGRNILGCPSFLKSLPKIGITYPNFRPPEQIGRNLDIWGS